MTTAQLEAFVAVASRGRFTEAARQLCFGLILGLGYPVLRARHRGDQAPTSHHAHEWDRSAATSG